MVNIFRTILSTRLFSAQIKDIEKIKRQVHCKASRTPALEKKLTALLAQIAIRNKNLKDPACTQKVLVAMKDTIEYRLSQDSWKKIKNQIERLLEQALTLSQTYQYHYGLLQVEALFNFLLEFHSIDDTHLETIEETTIPMEIIFSKRELLERLRGTKISEENVLLWNAILSPLIEENKYSVENFEYHDQTIQDAVNDTGKAIQETVQIFSKYRRVFFIIKLEQAFFELSQSKFEKYDMKHFIEALSNLRVSEKFDHIQEYGEKLEELAPDLDWKKMISGLENAMILYSLESEKVAQKKKILKYLSQLTDSFGKYKEFPITMMDALQGLINTRLVLANTQEENEKIKNKLEQVEERFKKIEEINLRIQDKSFSECIRDECLVFLKKDNVEEEIDKFLVKLFEKIISQKIKLSGIRAYISELTSVRKGIQWADMIAILEENIKSSKKDCDECIEQALKYLEGLRVGLMNVSDVKDCALHHKYPVCIEAIGNFLVFADSLKEDFGESASLSKLLKIELDKISGMLRNDYMFVFLSADQRTYFLRIIEEISLWFLDGAKKDTDAMKLFIIRLNALCFFIDDRELNAKSKKDILHFISEISKLVHFRIQLLPDKGKEKKESFLACEKIINFLITASKLPDNYLTLKFLNALEEQLLNALPASKISIAKAENNIRRMLVLKLKNFRKNKIYEILLPEEENNQYIKALAKIMGRELDKNSSNQDRESAELSSVPEDLEKRQEAKILIKQLTEQMKVIAKLAHNSKAYSAGNVAIAQTILSIVDLYATNKEPKAVKKRKAFMDAMKNILRVISQICQLYELDAEVTEKLKQSFVDFSLQRPLPTKENLNIFYISMDENLKKGLIKAVCEKYKLTLSILIRLEEEFSQLEPKLGLEEFLQKLENKVKEILFFKSEVLKKQCFIESEIQRINLAEKESREISAMLLPFKRRPLNMKDEEYQNVKNRLISLNENEIKLKHVQQRLYLEKKKAAFSKIKENDFKMSVNEEEASDFFFEINSRKIKKVDRNSQNVNKTINDLTKDIDNIAGSHPFLEISPHFFIRFRQSLEEKVLAEKFYQFKIELHKLETVPSDLPEKMLDLANKVRKMDETIYLFLSQCKKLSSRREKTLRNFQKILRGEALNEKERKDSAVSFCADNKAIKAARRYAIILLEDEIAALEKETKSFEGLSVDELTERERELSKSIEEERTTIQKSISFPKMREKLHSERSNLEAQRLRPQSKYAGLKSLDELKEDYLNIQSRLAR